MDPIDLLQLKELVPYFTWPVVAGLVVIYVLKPMTVWFIAKYARNRKVGTELKHVECMDLSEVTTSVAEALRTNHFHEWGDDLKVLKRGQREMLTLINRNTAQISNIKGWIKGKFNGSAKEL